MVEEEEVTLTVETVCRIYEELLAVLEKLV
jgi:hypothetical protein